MPVAAGIVGDLGMAARRVLAARDMAAERRRTTALDRTHHLRLIEAHMPAVGFTPGRAVVAENVRDLQSWSSHGRRRYGAALHQRPLCRNKPDRVVRSQNAPRPLTGARCALRWSRRAFWSSMKLGHIQTPV